MGPTSRSCPPPCLTDSRLCNLITNSESTTRLELSRCISTGDHFSNKTVLTQLLKQKHIDAVCRTAASCGSDMYECRNSLTRQNRISLNMPAGLQILHWLHPHVHMQYLLIYAPSGLEHWACVAPLIPTLVSHSLFSWFHWVSTLKTVRACACRDGTERRCVSNP